jgi:predicted nucleotidyltransferase
MQNEKRRLRKKEGRQIMLGNTERQLVERLKQLMRERGVPFYQTIVFGSRARCDARPDSDLDVLVLVEHLTPAIRKNISHCAWEVGFDAGILLQTVVMTRERAERGPEQSSLLILEINEEGVTV